MDLVCCRDCQAFIADKVGDGGGIGRCKKYEDYKLKDPAASSLRDAMIRLGNYKNDLFWGGTAKTRNCEKYQPI